jgi:hypothetical protein
MRRKTFDALLTMVGLVTAFLLLIVGIFLVVGGNYTTNQVHDQLTEQKIFFPAADSPAMTAKDFPGLQQYAGQQLVTGDQAEAYANQYIAKQIAAVSGGKSYSELSADARANPTDPAKSAVVEGVFKGQVQSAMLLNATAFDKLGQLIGYGAITSLVGSALMFILSVLGFLYLLRAKDDAQLEAPNREPIPV